MTRKFSAFTLSQKTKKKPHIPIIINHNIHYLGIIFVLRVESREFFAIRYN